MRDDGRTLHERVGPDDVFRPLARALILSILSVVGASTVVLATEVELDLALARQSTPAAARVVWNEVSRSNDDLAARHDEASLEAPGFMVLDLEPGSVWQVSVVSERFWAAPTIVSVGEDPMATRLELWPKTRVVGRLEVERAEEMPTEIGLRFESPPGTAPKIARSAVTCPVREGRFECALPASNLDLRLRAKHFVSHYFWDAELKPEARYGLGASTLRHGASIVGWVEMEDATASFDDAIVTLSRETASAMIDETTAHRRQALGLEATVSSRGFFELVGVPEGLYAVTVDHPAFAPGRYAPVQVLADAEAELRDPIPLHKAVTLKLEIQPTRPATSRHWNVELYRLGEAPGHLDLAADGRASNDGTWSRAGLTAGEYVLRVTDGAEVAWYREDLLLPAGSQTISHQVDLPAEDLVGRVLLGSEPVAAELYFGAFHGAIRVPARSDEEGLFEVRVPLRETWTVDVHIRAERVSQRFQNVMPESADETGRRWVQLVIPDTLVEGAVVDSQAQPVADARIQASGLSGGQTQRSDAGGAFVLRGLRPGKYWLRAKSKNRRSAMRRITVEPEEPAPPVELVLVENRQIDGQVVGPSGRGVVGATLVALIEQSNQQPIAFEIPEAVTDLTGSFTIELPDFAEGVLLTTFPPGFAARQVRADARSQEPVFIPVEPHGGTLRIHHGDAVPRHQLRIFKTWLLPVHFSLTNWASLHGETNTTAGQYSVPMLEPGHYQVCLLPESNALMTGRLEPGLEGSCRGGVLPPYGELVLDIR